MDIYYMGVCVFWNCAYNYYVLYIFDYYDKERIFNQTSYCVGVKMADGCRIEVVDRI